MAFSPEYQIERKKAAFKAWIKKEFPNEWDNIDGEAEFDKTLTFAELKSGTMKKYSLLKKPTEAEVVKEARAELRNQKQIEQEKAEQEQLRQQAQTEKLLLEAQREVVNAVNLEHYYQRLYASLDLIIGGKLNAAFVQSRAGLGKSLQIHNYLVKNGVDYSLLTGNISDAYLYRFLCENNGKVVVVRDIAKLLQSQRCVDMFKAATETHGKRIIRNLNYSKHNDGLPEALEVTSRFVFEFNTLDFNPNIQGDIEALLSRGDYYNLVLSFDEVADIMRKIAATEAEKEVTEYVISSYAFVGMNGFNLRLQQKAFRIKEYCEEKGLEWQERLKLFFTSEMSSTRKGLYALIGDKPTRTKELKRLLLLSHFENTNNLKGGDRKVREWIEIGELHIVGLADTSDEAIREYLSRNRNFAVSINPIGVTL